MSLALLFLDVVGAFDAAPRDRIFAAEVSDEQLARLFLDHGFTADDFHSFAWYITKQGALAEA